MTKNSATDRPDVTTADDNSGSRWVGFRPEIKVLDCTIRDGGLMNAHGFNDETVLGVYKACIEGGIDYMELGYKSDDKIFSPAEYGRWKFSREEDIRNVVGDNDTPLKLSVMADAERTDYHNDILPREDSVLDMIRVATYIHQIPTAIDMVKDAKDKGYEVCINIMAISTVQERELDNALKIVAESEADVIYLVDSFGALYNEQIDYFIRKYLSFAGSCGKEVGIHTHNNQQLGYANTIQAIISGANYLDASIGGLGRGAGNCPMELLVGFLHNPKFRLRPILECLQNKIQPLQSELKWGFDPSYMITGKLNQHPRAAIQFNAGEGPKDLVGFYDSVVDEE